MASYSEIRGKACRSKYASGGRVAGKDGRPSKTVINIVVPPSAPGGMPGAGAAPAPAAPQNSPSGGVPVPPAAAAMALQQMQGKPGAPGMFARGGRVHSDVKADKAMVRGMVKPAALKANGGKVPARPAPSTKKAGAEGARGRLQKTAAAKARGKRPGQQIR